MSEELTMEQQRLLWEYEAQVRRHDFGYIYSDSFAKYKAGSHHMTQIMNMELEMSEVGIKSHQMEAIWNKYAPESMRKEDE